MYIRLTTSLTFRKGRLSCSILPIQCLLVMTAPLSSPIFPITNGLISFATLFSRTLNTFMEWTTPLKKLIIGIMQSNSFFLLNERKCFHTR